MGNKIFIGGLSYTITELELSNVFEQFGKVINLRIVRNQETGESKGFGFVTFSSELEAEKALSMDGQKINGRLVGVRIAHERKK
jgi:RNA recognition motif-containing protein